MSTETPANPKPKRRWIPFLLAFLVLAGFVGWQIVNVFQTSVDEPVATVNGEKEPDKFLFFSDAWAKEWGRRINKSDVYRQSSKGWRYKTSLVRLPDADLGFEDKGAIFLDLYEGECRVARTAEPGDVESSEFVLEATPIMWKEIVAGERSIHPALVTGKVKLAKGSLITLLRFIKAANEMTALSTRINTEFQDKILAASPLKSKNVDEEKVEEKAATDKGKTTKGKEESAQKKKESVKP